MNDEMTTLDQTDEEILTYMVSDEALEDAARTERAQWGSRRATVIYPPCGLSCP